MKLRFEQLTGQLQRSLSPVYTLTGDESVLIDEALELIKYQARQQNFNECISCTVDSGFNWEEWLANTQNNSLFAERQIIVLHITNGKPGDKGSAALQQYCQHLSSDTILIVICPKLDSSSLKTKWWLALDNAGITLQIWPLDSHAQTAWFLNRMKQAQLTIDPAATDWLIQQTTGNLLATKQCIEQFKLLFKPGTMIQLSDLQSCMNDQGQFDVFNLVDACNLGDRTNSLRILRKLQVSGTEAILIIWALTRELRQLQQMHEKLRLGQPLDIIMREQRIPPMRKRAIETALKRINQSTIYNLLQQATVIDAAVKGANTMPLWPTLERWCLSYSGATL
jgi:DNA polymerase-3 subunit delta